MLTKLVLLPVLFVIALGIGIALNAALRRKHLQWLPARRPWFCILPKYVMNLDLTSPREGWEDEVHQRITRLGFKLSDKNEDFWAYERGHDYADFLADAVRIAIVVRHPIANPAVIGLQYASKFGVAFDTGDLWKVADSIRTALTPSGKQPTGSTISDDATVTTSRRHATWISLLLLFAAGCLAVMGVGAVFVWRTVASDRIHAVGDLQPIVRQDVHAAEDAIVERVIVKNGDVLKKGTALLGLRSDDRAFQRADLLRQIEKQKSSLSALQTKLASSRNISEEERLRIIGALQELKASIDAIKDKIKVVEKRIEELTLLSPIDGTVITVAEKLMPGRQVTRGDYLLTVADPSGPWGFNVQLDEAKLGSLVRAKALASGPLAVDFQLGTDSRWGRGVVTDVSPIPNAPGARVKVEIDVAHLPPELLIPGTTVKAVILLSPR